VERMMKLLLKLDIIHRALQGEKVKA